MNKEFADHEVKVIKQRTLKDINNKNPLTIDSVIAEATEEDERRGTFNENV